MFTTTAKVSKKQITLAIVSGYKGHEQSYSWENKTRTKA